MVSTIEEEVYVKVKVTSEQIAEENMWAYDGGSGAGLAQSV
jgi:hypothetical protein